MSEEAVRIGFRYVRRDGRAFSIAWPTTVYPQRVELGHEFPEVNVLYSLTPTPDPDRLRSCDLTGFCVRYVVSDPRVPGHAPDLSLMWACSSEGCRRTALVAYEDDWRAYGDGQSGVMAGWIDGVFNTPDDWGFVDGRPRCPDHWEPS